MYFSQQTGERAIINEIAFTILLFVGLDAKNFGFWLSQLFKEPISLAEEILGDYLFLVLLPSGTLQQFVFTIWSISPKMPLIQEAQEKEIRLKNQ